MEGDVVIAEVIYYQRQCSLEAPFPPEAASSLLVILWKRSAFHSIAIYSFFFKPAVQSRQEQTALGT